MGIILAWILRQAQRRYEILHSSTVTAGRLTAHGVDDDHGGVDGAAQRDHSADGDRGVVGAEGAKNAQVARAVGQLAENELSYLWTKNIAH